MYIRCANCHGSLWVITGPKLPRVLGSTCKSCDQVYRLTIPASYLGPTTEQLHDDAAAYAREHDVDLPGAYSVVLGIMKLEELQELGHQFSPLCHPRKADEADDGPRRITYDRAFIAAVEAGALTPAQARDRGKRETFARRIAIRHRLGMAQAYAIADNRESLLQAVRQRTATSPIAAEVHRPAPLRAQFLLATLALLVGAVVGAGFESRAPAKPVYLNLEAPAVGRTATEPAGPSPERVRQVLRSATEVETDAEGNVTRVVGPHPRQVLDAFCEAVPAARYEALDIAATMPAAAHARLGLVRDVHQPLATLAVTIRRDPESQLWRLGDGSLPVEPHTAPAAALAIYAQR